MRIEDSDTALTLAAGADEAWTSAEGVPMREPRDWRLLYERERARAEAAEARAEELRWAEVAARCDAGSWKSRFEASRRKLKAAVEQAKEAGDAAKNALSLQAEVVRLNKLLSAAGVESSRHSTIMSLRMEVARLRKAVPGAEAQDLEMRQLHRALLSEDVSRLRRALKAAEAAKERLKARLLRATDAARSILPRAEDAQLRKFLRRSRRQKTTIDELSRENARLRRTAKASRSRIETLEAQLAKLHATRAVLSKALFGRKSEKRETPRSGRRRGQQRGAPGHGRTRRPALEERTEEHNPPADARACSCCGRPYAAIGAEQSTLVEIEVRAHKRVIRRPRWRRTCDCASSPVEVSAPPVPRLFANTPYGTSVWSRFLFERYACLRPLQRVAAWLSDQGLPVSPGTLADSVPRFVPLFEPLADAILAHQNTATLRHADETTWRVQAHRDAGRSGRAWLWTSVGGDAAYFHIDASRSAEAAQKLFAEAMPHTVIVCDRYSAYKKLARLRGGLVTLAWCWAHQRRDFIDAAAGQVRLTAWCRAWVERIASIYRLNEARLTHYDPGLKSRTLAFDAAHGALEVALDSLFADAERELAGLPDRAREGKALRSLANHREGLSVFVDRPQVPLDNNLAERLLRGPAIGRRLSFGSDSWSGARFTALMYSVIGTLTLNGIDVPHWLKAWLTACADNGGCAPDDLSPWLPWSMDAERRNELMAPG